MKNQKERNLIISLFKKEKKKYPQKKMKYLIKNVISKLKTVKNIKNSSSKKKSKKKRRKKKSNN